MSLIEVEITFLLLFGGLYKAVYLGTHFTTCINIELFFVGNIWMQNWQ